MLHKKIKLINKLGLHARASMKLIDTANKFGSNIIIKFDNKEVNAKSILNIMVLGAKCGSELTLEVTGSDEERAMQAICDLINNRFGEAE